MDNIAITPNTLNSPGAQKAGRLIIAMYRFAYEEIEGWGGAARSGNHITGLEGSLRHPFRGQG